MKLISRHFIALFLCGILICTLVWAVSQSVIPKVSNSNSLQKSVPCRVVQHVKGESCIPLNPKRIVTLDFNSFAAVLALDVKPIATWITNEIESDFDYFQGKADGVEIIRSSSGQINLETLLLLRPDLIIVVSQPFFNRIYQYTSKIAPTVVLPWIETKGNWQQHIQDVANILQRTQTATELMGEYNQRINNLKQIINHEQQELRISFAYVAAGQLVITRKQSFAGKILADIGILNPIFAESGDLDLAISEELLPKIDSDILFIAPLRKDDNSVIQKLQQKPIWSKLKAVQQNQVYLVDFSVWRGLNILAAYEVLDELYQYILKMSKFAL
ncbi:iron-siderophore ABC transporter substrate-binding protein [Nostoc sp. FACHB-87]|uniref:iron-siderophore ABC transporter substrate-binding protein n=1 Tax=Nostocaceae TaxID=1162 RepID=UPI0016887D52|nr:MULTISPECIES: iron-siderophore ABC transporter substrate-binding protein [Nostocaceae]MBD2453059.1 iron-siderophore ABC transporter substrate-binding protein [Nostoc sp. FACHB-87]MBD2475163.1 iron-siderophore ABC transporter substrate-binding protein [Anabaena sp. FACHB-83]